MWGAICPAVKYTTLRIYPGSEVQWVAPCTQQTTTGGTSWTFLCLNWSWGPALPAASMRFVDATCVYCLDLFLLKKFSNLMFGVYCTLLSRWCCDFNLSFLLCPYVWHTSAAGRTSGPGCQRPALLPIMPSRLYIIIKSLTDVRGGSSRGLGNKRGRRWRQKEK